MEILPFRAVKIAVSKNTPAVKAVLELKDQRLIETVLMSPKPGIWSACVSSQVGCPLGCLFCATGRDGFKRNLTAEEIGGQVLFWKNYLKKQKTRLTNVVYMGMGEPFLNYENVKESLNFLTDKIGLGRRSLSVSTAGVPEGIKKFAVDFPQINLAVSLHFSDNEKRSRFMPVNRKYNLKELGEALTEYLRQTNRQIFIEYILLAGLNDQFQDARSLIKYLRSLGPVKLLHVNLIRYNSIGNEFDSSSREQAAVFLNILKKAGLSATIRKSLGDDICGACGQLAEKKYFSKK
jgi:adenine C2-methylase RlmN of 23S rRNA A2503 and tRNA A37